MRTTGGPPIDWEYFKKAYENDKNKRRVYWDNLEYIDNELNKMGYSLPQRQAILFNIYQESGGDPKAMGKNNSFAGLMQWDIKNRYPRIKNKSMNGQLQYLNDTVYGSSAMDDYSWSPKKYRKPFLDATTAPEAVRWFADGYVRPGTDVVNNRIALSRSYFPNSYDRYGSASTRYNTQLTPKEEVDFASWRAKLPLNLQSDYDYDLRGAFINGYNPDENGHMTDLFKKPNHPTFSMESYYSTPDHIGGMWNGEEFIPSEWNKKQAESEPVPQGIDFYYRTGPSLLPPTYASGGSIHIKPENRGKFTALKERTGHSATWFKQNGTPAQKKMATFALNAAKWKHK